MRFAHASERLLAEMLDFYGIAWDYEPVEFALDWDAEGRPVSGFRPDFYLPEHGLFLELTTLRQRLVTKKNAKLRRLCELHPELNIRILYRRDCASLELKALLGGFEPARSAHAPSTMAG
ncbi:MAG: hypothetical protein WCF24_04305 [Acidimicrobiales bacterium]